MTTDRHKIEYLNRYRITGVAEGGELKSTEADGMNGAFWIPCYNAKTERYDLLGVISSDGGGWEHVSVTVQSSKRSQGQAPSWEQMCRVKRAFWDEEETVVEYHVPMSEWVNEHPGCLHLWRPIGVEIPRPPALFVGLPDERSDRNTSGSRDMSAELQMFVLYHDPLDYPGKWILRRWVVTPGNEPAADLVPLAVADSRDEALAPLPIGLYCLGRFREDEPQIHEVWI